MTDQTPPMAAPPPEIEPNSRRDRTHWLYIAVIVAVVAGVIVGLVAPDLGSSLGILGTLFVSLIKMMISPIIYCTIVLGIGSVRNAASVGKVGGLAMAYFLTMSTVALAIGLLVGNLISPGTGLNISGNADAGAKLAEQAHGAGGAMEFFEHIIPTSLLSSLTEGNVLQTPVRSAAGRVRASGDGPLRGAGPARHRANPEAGLPHLDRHPVAGTDRRVRCHGEGGRRHRFRRGRPTGRADAGLLSDLHHLRVRRAGGVAAGSCQGVDLQAGALPGPRVPADRRDVVARRI